MPIRVYECSECNIEQEEFFHNYEIPVIYCSECGKIMKRPVGKNAARPDHWKPITLEHIADEPMTFRTRKELKDYCDNNQVSSAALL